MNDKVKSSLPGGGGGGGGGAVARVRAVVVALAVGVAALCGGGGCTNSCGAPILLVPFATVAILADEVGNAVDRHLLYGLDNADFVLAGRVVDGDGRGVEGVRVSVKTYAAVHGGVASGTEEHEATAADGSFTLTVRKCWMASLRFTKPAYGNAGVSFWYDRDRQYENNQLRSAGLHVEEKDGEPAYHFTGGARPQVSDLRIVLDAAAAHLTSPGR